MFEIMQEEFRNQPQQCPTLSQVWQRVTRVVHMGKIHTQDTRPTVRGRSGTAAAAVTTTTAESASLNALSGSTNSRKRQSQGNSNEEPPVKRGSKRNSYRKRETKDDWAEFPVCKSCKMRHPKEDED